MGNSCHPQDRNRKVKFSPSQVEMMSFNSEEEHKNVPINVQSCNGDNNTNNNSSSTSVSSPERTIEQLVEQLYVTDNRENYFNARLLLQEGFFSAETVLAFESQQSPVSASFSATLKSTENNVVDNERGPFERFGRHFRKARKLSYAKFCQTLLKKRLDLPTSGNSCDEKTNRKQQQFDNSSSTLAVYRALLYSEHLDITLSSSFRRHQKSLKKIMQQRAVLASGMGVFSLGDKLFAGSSVLGCNNSPYFCFTYYPFTAKVLEFTMMEVACIRLISGRSPNKQQQQQLLIDRRFWFELFNLLYESADIFSEYWKTSTQALSKNKQKQKGFVSFSVSTAEPELCSDVRLQALLGLEIRLLLKAYSNLSDTEVELAEKLTTQIINFATVVLELPPKTGAIGVPGSHCRDLCWDELLDDYYEGCKGRRPFFYPRRSFK